MIVKWKTGVGYGDFVTGLGYAHTASIKYQIPVDIEFHWNHSKDHLFSPKDPETIVDRCNYVYSVMKQNPMVTMSHKFDANAKFRFYNQLDEFNPLHGIWYSSLKNTTKLKHVALWTTENNLSFPGIFKDPVNNRWNEVREKLSDCVIEEITYRTPVREAIEIIRRCEFGIGYDGLAHQLFKFMWKPLIVFCKRIKLNRLLIPQAHLIETLNEFLYTDTNILVNESRRRIEFVKKQHEDYMNEKMNPNEHRLFNTFIY
jgi:hypothetical protein